MSLINDGAAGKFGLERNAQCRSHSYGNLQMKTVHHRAIASRNSTAHSKIKLNEPSAIASNAMRTAVCFDTPTPAIVSNHIREEATPSKEMQTTKHKAITACAEPQQQRTPNCLRRVRFAQIVKYIDCSPVTPAPVAIEHHEDAPSPKRSPITDSQTTPLREYHQSTQKKPYAPKTLPRLSYGENQFSCRRASKVAIYLSIQKPVHRLGDWLRHLAQVGEWDVQVLGYGRQVHHQPDNGTRSQQSERKRVRTMMLYRERRGGRGRRLSSLTHWSRKLERYWGLLEDHFRYTNHSLETGCGQRNSTGCWGWDAEQWKQFS